MPDLLAIVPYPNRSADTRYRVSQFIPGLESAGWHVTLRPFMDESFYSMYDQPGRSAEKIIRTFFGAYKRMFDCLTAKKFSAILIHKEAFPFGPPIMENLLHQQLPRIVYDMDDAFWTHPPQLRQFGRSLRDPGRIGKMLKMSGGVLAGNEYLASYARQFNSHVTVFPTVIDTGRYYLRKELPDNEVTVGWVGRWSSSPYLERLGTALDHLSRRCSEMRVRLVGAGKVNFPQTVHLETTSWHLETEIEDIATFDIGMMPLPNDQYSQGKCGFKLLQYMALGIPSVASPVGVNKLIIQDGVNGFLAETDTEWEQKLSALIVNPNLRSQMGQAARKTVEEEFSLKKALPVLTHILDGLNG